MKDVMEVCSRTPYASDSRAQYRRRDEMNRTKVRDGHRSYVQRWQQHTMANATVQGEKRELFSHRRNLW